MGMGSLLQVKHLTTSFHTDRGVTRAVDDVSFSLDDGEVVGIVGESGCGKSVTALSIMGLVPRPAGQIEAGSILFEGQDLLTLKEVEMRKIRGGKIAMIFQDPMTSLNPVYTIESQIAEAVRLHQGRSRREAVRIAAQALSGVHIPDPERRLREHPHELSGGMRQRVMIAMALCCEPKLIIADEPTTALDVTIQAQIMDLMGKLQADHGMSIIMISHNLGVIAEMANRVLVMYAGQIVEKNSVQGLFEHPLHPYTKGLIASSAGRETQGERRRLRAIPGRVPNLTELPRGCRFETRCEDCFDQCRLEAPDLMEVGEGRWVRCFKYTQ
ncbi:MAG: ABC transporter ATP-binding protein [Thermodesulfobacteriota bacterium]|nr:ABC transporter ATP-binding protein [Thermodesulfobacteriota bacterium]